MKKKIFKATRFGLQNLEDPISNILKPIFNNSKKEFIVVNNLVKNWIQIIGNKHYNLCYPKQINFDKDNNGKLIIAVYNPSIGFFIEQNSEIILEKIAKLYGFKSIKKIVIKQEPKDVINQNNKILNLSSNDKNKINQILNLVEDEELKLSLEKLGYNIFDKK